MTSEEKRWLLAEEMKRVERLRRQAISTADALRTMARYADQYAALQLHGHADNLGRAAGALK